MLKLTTMQIFYKRCITINIQIRLNSMYNINEELKISIVCIG